MVVEEAEKHIEGASRASTSYSPNESEHWDADAEEDDVGKGMNAKRSVVRRLKKRAGFLKRAPTQSFATSRADDAFLRNARANRCPPSICCRCVSIPQKTGLQSEHERAMVKLKDKRIKKRTGAKRAANGGEGKALQSFDMLAAALPSMDSRGMNAAADPHRSSMKSGMHSSTFLSKIRFQESRRHDQIRSHPKFVEDPLAAITAHLKQTLPDEPTRPTPKSRGRRNRRPGNRAS